MAAGALPQNEQPYSTLVNNSGYAANMKGNSSFVFLLIFILFYFTLFFLKYIF